MELTFADLPPAEAYRVLVGTILPRPIAWILSENADGSLNLAPFSYFTIVSSRPATVVVSIGSRADGSPKDTRRNLLAGRPAVLHLGHAPLVDAVNASAAPLPPGVSELEDSDLACVPFPGGPLPRLAACPVAFHARYSQHVLLGEGAQAAIFLGEGAQAAIFLELTHVHLDDHALRETPTGEEWTIDPLALAPLARLGGNAYTTLGPIFERERPSAPKPTPEQKRDI